MTSGGFSPKRLTRVREVLERYVDAGYVPGAIAVIARHGEVHIEALGTLAFEGAGAETPMAADTICRTGSMTKPIVAACAMTLVEDCTLRLDDPVDEFLPELTDMRVLADPNGPLDDTVPANRPITLRDLLTFTLGTGMVPAEPGTIPIADALRALHDEPEPPPDEWIRRAGALPLVYQPGERWMYHTAANVTGVLIARATGMSFGDALRERICGPLGMTDTGFSVAGENISRLSTAYQPDQATGELVVEDGPDGYWSRPPAFEDGGGGLVSTASDYLAFASALMAGGAHDGERVLSRPSVTLMTTDHLTPSQKAVSGFRRTACGSEEAGSRRRRIRREPAAAGLCERQLAAADLRCVRRARAAGPASLVLFDVSTLYFETDEGDGFRESGFSKERRSNQIT